MGAIVRVINWSCFLAAFAVPAAVAALLIKNAVSAEASRRGVILKATIALAVWVFISAALLLITFGLAYASHGAYLSEGWRPTAGYFVMHLGYLLTGAGLVYWVWRRGRDAGRGGAA